MVDEDTLAIAMDDLGELIDTLDPIANGKEGHRGLDTKNKHKQIMRLIKGWIKISVLLDHSNYLKDLSARLVQKRDPESHHTITRTKVLYHAMNVFLTALQHNKTTEGDFFNYVDAAMVDLVRDYRKQLSGKVATEFEAELIHLMSTSKDKLMQEAMFRMDQSL